MCLAACVAEDTEQPVEDLGNLGGKADKITTRNVTLRKHRADGTPSVRTFTITTAEAFRVSVGYEPDAQTRVTVSDSSGESESPLTWQPTLAIPAAGAARTIKIRLENADDDDVAVKLHVESREPRTLRVATWNIRWYGIGGDVDAPTTEGRNPSLRAFFDAHFDGVDLIMFEEILDVEMLRAEIVPAGWTCSTYENHQANHQFVVGCLAPNLVLTREADDVDVAYQPVGAGSLRPAIAGIVRDVATRAPIARLVGVHLKALPNSTDRRLEQAGILAERLVALAANHDELPTIALGDFNAHRAVDTGKADDDWNLIEGVLAAGDLELVENPFTNTYRDKNAKAYKLDHMYLSSSARAAGLEVIGPCNLSWETNRAEIEKYFDTVSDHCPLIANVTLQ